MRVSAPDSPCMRNCTLDARDTCLGCGRTLTEILDWHGLDPAGRQAAFERARARLADRTPWRRQ